MNYEFIGMLSSDRPKSIDPGNEAVSEHDWSEAVTFQENWVPNLPKTNFFLFIQVCHLFLPTKFNAKI